MLVVLAACSDDPAAPQGETSTGVADTTTGTDEPHAVLLGAVPNTVCDDPAVVSVELQAVKVGCEDPLPAPCTVPSNPEPVVGDRVSCPITDNSVTLGVRVELAAVYQVEAVLDRSPDAADGLCFGAEEPTRVLVSTEDLEAHAQKMLDATGQACPTD